MREVRREPEVPEERVVECFGGINHSEKSGTLQNACSTTPRVVADLEKSARMHIVRLMNNLEKGPKRFMTKVQ